MTLRYILVILSFLFSASAEAQLYRVFFKDKGNIKEDMLDTPVNKAYLDIVKDHADSLWMHSNWLNYALVQHKTEPVSLLKFDFVDRIEKVEPLLSIPLEINKKDSMDTEAMDEHRNWQLDTMGGKFFRENHITGKGITIAIIDAGFSKANESRAFQHIYATKRVLKTYDFIDHDSDVYHGSSHGTSVWSLIAGNLDGKQTGLATNASFILLRSEDAQTETMADEDRWIQAIEKAYEWGADVVNSSIGFSNVLHKRSDLDGQTLISKAADMAAKKGMLVVISAGNEWISAWKTLAVPADADGVITVGGIDKEGKQSYFSSVGPTADGRAKPDVVAPGTCVVVKGNELSLGNGTSYAAPLVAGYLACMLEWKGEKNFTKDSLKYHGGLYPYFDYTYGYGVPFYVKAECSGAYLKCGYLGVDKEKLKVNIPPYCVLNYKDFSTLFVKIISVEGKIKYYNRFLLKGKKSISIRTGKFQQFGLKTYSDPESSDIWITWWNNCYKEY